jgi:hypothetical protein
MHGTAKRVGGISIRGEQHVCIGALSMGAALLLLPKIGVPVGAEALFPAVAAAAAGSLAPDLDHPWSKASFAIPTTLIAFGGVYFVARWAESLLKGPKVFTLSMLGPGLADAAGLVLGTGVALLTLSLILGRLFKHRGPVHSFAVGALASAVFAAIALVAGWPLWLTAAFAWGWLLHLLADAATPTGLPALLWPLGSKAREPIPPIGAQLPAASAERPQAGMTAPPGQPVAVAPVCPKCGSHMVLRTAKRGPQTGAQFYGCSSFPRCRHVAALDSVPRSEQALPADAQ